MRVNSPVSCSFASWFEAVAGLARWTMPRCCDSVRLTIDDSEETSVVSLGQAAIPLRCPSFPLRTTTAAKTFPIASHCKASHARANSSKLPALAKRFHSVGSSTDTELPADGMGCPVSEALNRVESVGPIIGIRTRLAGWLIQHQQLEVQGGEGWYPPELISPNECLHEQHDVVRSSRITPTGLALCQHHRMGSRMAPDQAATALPAMD